jgi:hypothetical protein
MQAALHSHAALIAAAASELAEALAAADGSMPPLIAAVGLVELEDVRARLAKVAESLLLHAAAK